MDKEVKKVYLPSGLLASMYNLYGGTGKDGEVLSTYDIQIMCACLEFYFNSQNSSNQRYQYKFYTMPQFYSGRINELDDVKLKMEFNRQSDKYARKYSDGEFSSEGELLKIAEDLRTRKRKIIGRTIPAFFRITDPISYSAWLDSRNFNVDEPDGLTSKRRFNGEKMFSEGLALERSYFYMLNPNVSKSVLTAETFKNSDEEMRKLLKHFMNSDSYKLLEKNKSEHYAPQVNDFVECFQKAIEAYKTLGFNEINKLYLPRIKAQQVETEIVGGN